MKFIKTKLLELRDAEKLTADREMNLYRAMTYLNAAFFLGLLALAAYFAWTHVSKSQIHGLWALVAAGLILGLNAVYFYRIRLKREEQLESENAWDPITGAWSASYFENKLQEEIVRAGRYRYPLSLCVMDLDHFRSFNENFGPKRGDDLLKQFSVVLQSHIRTTDIFARFEDDAFYMILPHTDLIRSERVIERLLEQTIEELDVKFRAGVAAYIIGENRHQLLERAKNALAHAKRENSKRIQCLVSDGEHYTTVEF